MRPKILTSLIQSGELLQTAMRALLAEVKVEPRVQSLVRELAIEKSTASRVARGIRAPDGECALREFPAVDGIAKVVAACEARGASTARLATARQALDELRGCFSKVPGGRAVAIEALGGDTTSKARGRSSAKAPGHLDALTRNRGRAERAAARAIFTGYRCFAGATSTHQYSLRVQCPTSRSDLFEPASVSVNRELMRLRAGAPLHVHSSRIQQGPESPCGLLTLEGDQIGFHIERTLMREFCAGPCDRLQSRREGAYVRLELGPKDPPIDKPMTIAIGFRQLSRDRRFATARERFACIRHMLRRPVESLVIDFMVPSGYLRDVIPRYRREHDPFATPDLLNGPPVEEFGAVGYSAEYQPMGRGIPPREPGHAGTISADADVVARAFERMSLDPDDFERYRLSVRYPLPGVWHEMWYRLPERPTHARSRTESPRTGLRGARRAQG